ncbi:L-threonylcarbamoyladenylate synthase [Tautonia rosea]|uniref:L-threonylcarbamoyladenylate synthase n=1 Tax=Tautonia rosea TaxID=2728037 RepID=UPI00147617E6|nr:L-threonylcarbamoyladenylate synthase [Tautonia rosea]
MTRATPIRSIAPDNPDAPALIEAAEILLAGGLVAFPTETVYGLGADATNPEAVARIFSAKGRPSTNPLIVHTDGPELARRCVSHWSEAAETLARHFWPGPLTLVLPRSALIPDLVTGGRDTVGVRVPDVPVARSLISRVGRPLAAPSANRSTGISPTRAEHVSQALNGRIDLILDAGPTAVGLESTVLDLTSDPPRILRPGPIQAEALSLTLGRTVLERHALTFEHNLDEPAASPGLMAIHYAPRTLAIRVEPGEPIPPLPSADRIAVLSIGPAAEAFGPFGVRLRIDLADPKRAARVLYDALHHCDASGAELILVLMPPDLPDWAAVRDRLLRATQPA